MPCCEKFNKSESPEPKKYGLGAFYEEDYHDEKTKKDAVPHSCFICAFGSAYGL